MKIRAFVVICLASIGLLPLTAEAAIFPLTYRYHHHVVTVSPARMKEWQSEEEVWTWHESEIVPPAALRVDGDSVPALPAGFAKSEKQAWNEDAIAQTIREQLSGVIEREAGSVTISKSASGSIVFEGVGFPGRTIDMQTAVRLTVEALEAGISDIELPVIETQPTVNVLDEELKARGIKEFVTLGESDFRGSTVNRIHNVTVGLNRFNGHLIEQGETFSFVEVLGPVDAAAGYRKELTIIGDKTLPDYGGGLCQVSSTMYRGVWEYGFPITQRKNHSYAVSYYAPQGTDATVYPPNIDVKFLNDSPGALLIQTVIDVPNTKAYFMYYGTRDTRKTSVIGPFSWDRVGAPPPRTEYTLEIPAGTKRKVGEAVMGMKTAWFRTVEKDGEETVESVYSTYQARPLYWQIGVETLPAGSGALTEAPAGEAVISD